MRYCVIVGCGFREGVWVGMGNIIPLYSVLEYKQLWKSTYQIQRL